MAHQPSFSDLIGAAHLDSLCSSASTVSSLSMSIMPASTNAAKAAGPTYSWERRQVPVHTDEGRDCFGCGSTKGRQGSLAGPQRNHPYLQSRKAHRASSPPPVTGFEDMNSTDAELTVGSRPLTGSALEQTDCDDAGLSLGPGIPVACRASSAKWINTLKNLHLESPISAWWDFLLQAVQPQAFVSTEGHCMKRILHKVLWRKSPCWHDLSLWLVDLGNCAHTMYFTYECKRHIHRSLPVDTLESHTTIAIPQR